MTRLEAEARLQFYALPAPLIPLIASYIAVPHGARLFDPCAGEGIAAGTMAELWGIPKSMRYFNDLHDERAHACAAWASHTLCCDALKSLQAGRHQFQVAYLNPPFGHDAAEEGTGRIEEKFFRRWLDDAPAMQPGAVVIYVAPQYVFASPGVITHLARVCDATLLLQHPAAYRRFGEAVMIGILRSTPRSWADQKAEVVRLTAILAGDLPILTHQATAGFIAPAPSPITRIIWRDASRGTPAMAQLDVMRSGGAFTSKKYRADRAIDRTQLQPAFPLQVAQAALRIAAGAINGTTVVIDGVPMTIKGTTRRSTVARVDRFSDGDTEIVEIHRLEKSSPHVTAINEATGEVVSYDGDVGIAALMTDAATAQALLHAVEASAPPKYAFDMPANVAHTLGALRPVSGRHLPGHAPGLLPMQQHAAAALLTTLTTPDPGWGGAIPNGAIVAAEMGCGKTTIGLAAVELLRLLRDT